MAHSEESWLKAKSMFEAGKSLTNIESDTGISKGQISKKSKKENWQKETLKNLAKREIDTTIIQNEIEKEKETLNATQRKQYNEVFISLSHHHNLFNSSTIENQLLANQATEEIKKDIDNKNNKITAIDHLPNIMAISKVTEANRKQLYGNTETYEPKKKDDDKDNKGIKVTYE